LEEGKIFIEDLNSTNGTFVNQKQLEPHTPTEISSGDQLLLGRLGIQLLFR
jgi:pSer/pThr/pTyr-binding forkhead associated (FHA) protein